MPSRKRKAPEAEEAPPKKSKAQQRAEAKARAAQWALETKAKKAVKKSASAKKAPKPEPVPVPDSPSPEKKEAKRPRVADAKPAAVVAPVGSASKTKSKKQLAREQGRQLARQWAESQKQKQSSKKVNSFIPTETHTDVEPVTQSPVPPAHAFAHQPVVPAAAVPRPPAFAPPPPPVEPTHSISVQPVFVPPPAPPVRVAAVAPPTYVAHKEEEEEEEETPFDDAQETLDEDATKTEGEEELQNQISQQVMANALAVHSPAPTHAVVEQPQAYAEPQYYSPQPQLYQQAAPEYDHDEAPPRRKWGLFAIFSVVAVVVAFVAAQFLDTSNAGVGGLPTATKVHQELPSCFLSNAPDMKGEDGEPLPMVGCDMSLKRLACPDRGICQNGFLQSCSDPRFDVAETKNICILSEISNVTMSLVEQTLVEWTIEDKCGLSGCEFARKSSSMGPVFPLQKLQEGENLTSVDMEFLRLSPDFHVDDDDEVVFVGLSDGYMEDKLVLPFVCSCFLFCVAVLAAVLKVAFGWLGFGTGIMWKLTMAYPLVSLVCLAVLVFLRNRRRQREEGRRLIQDVANVRELAYRKLMNDPETEHVVLHLRDEIAYELYPMSKTGRRYINMTVWKHVVGEVRVDNRVEKTERMVQGRPRDVWRWVAAARQTAVSFE